MRKARLVSAFFCAALVGIPLLAHAKGPLRLARRLPLDPGVPSARDVYAKLDTQERFGIKFRPYASVCPPVAEGRARCLAKVVTNWHGVPLSLAHMGGDMAGYGPKEFRVAYHVPGTASGQPVIGIVDAYGYPWIYSDLKVYSRQFNLPSLPKCKVNVASSPVACIQVVNQKGGKRLPKIVDAGWSQEQSIDVQLAHAICENCSILLVEANTNGDGDMFPALKTAAALGANVISNSWGTDDSAGGSGTDKDWLTYPGVAVTAATGDKGYAGGIIYPSSSPNAVAVGGTSLFLKSNGKYQLEVAWSGTGSGCSASEARPSWQPLLSGCPSNRTVSDISVDADPNTGAAIFNSDPETCIGTKNCWFEFGGTSMSAPIVAAMFALAGPIPQTVIQPSSILYANVSKKNSRDIVSGSTGDCDVGYLCNALPGYDGPTGLGTPKGLDIFIAR